MSQHHRHRGFFSRKDYFLLRGVRDTVYLTENRCCFPRAYEITGETVSAMGATWHDIHHVSERLIRHYFRCFGKGQLSLKDATLYQVKGEKTVYVVLLGTRYGIPDQPTLHRLWGNTPRVNYVDNPSAMDEYLPGRDLASRQYWPERLR